MDMLNFQQVDKSLVIAVNRMLHINRCVYEVKVVSSTSLTFFTRSSILKGLGIKLKLEFKTP